MTENQLMLFSSQLLLVIISVLFIHFVILKKHKTPDCLDENNKENDYYRKTWGDNLVIYKTKNSSKRNRYKIYWGDFTFLSKQIIKYYWCFLIIIIILWFLIVWVFYYLIIIFFLFFIHTYGWLFMIVIFPLNLLLWHRLFIYLHSINRNSDIWETLILLRIKYFRLYMPKIELKTTKEYRKIYGKILTANSMMVIGLIILSSVLSSGFITMIVFIKPLMDYYN